MDPEPKTRKVDLFDREEELSELLKSRERLIVLAAPRRMGKTSLLNVFLSLIPNPSIKIDGRELWARGVTNYNVLKMLGDGLTSIIPAHNRVLDFFEFDGAIMNKKSIRFDHRKVSVLDVLKALNRFGGTAKCNFFLGIDEAQYFRFGKKFDTILAYSLDNLRNLSFVLTGSEVGILHDFLGFDDPKAPLYGRYFKVITLRRPTEREALEFLRKGLEEMGAEYKLEDLKESVEKLDGIMGWLTSFGYSYATGKVKLEAFVERAVKMVESELEELYKKSDRYRLILGAIGRGLGRWSEIYESVSIRVGPISESNFSLLLENLAKMGFIDKLDGRYVITDPIVREASRRER